MPTLLLLPDVPHFTIVNVNTAWLTATGTCEADLIGRGIFEAFPCNREDVFSDPVSHLRRSLLTVLNTRKPHKIAARHHKLSNRDIDKAGTRYEEQENIPVLDDEGNVALLIHSVADVTEKSKTDEKDRFKAELLRTIGQAVMATDMKGTINFWNKAAEEIYGWTGEEAIGKNVVALIPPQQTKKQAIEIIEELSRGRSWSGEFVVQRKDGGTFPVFVTDAPIYDEQQRLSGIISVSSDITHRKQIERRLEMNQWEMAVIYNTVSDIIFLLSIEEDGRFKFISVNHAFLKTTGLESGKVIGQYADTIIPRDSWTIAVANYRKAIDTKTTVQWEGSSEYPTGIRTGLVSITPVIDQDGNCIRLVGSVHDITGQKKILTELVDREAKLKNAQKIAKLGYWQSDMDGQHIYWSDEVYNIWGVKKDSFEVNFPSFFKSIHPDDKAEFTKEQAATFAGEKDLDFEHRIILPDGSVKWVHEKAKLVTDEHDHSILFEGTVQDITPQKLLALSLEESNQRYDYVTKATFDAIWDWDLVKETIFWGEGFQTLFGYNLGNVQQSIQSWTDHIHPDDIARVLKSIREFIAGTQTNWVDEYRFHKADGAYAYVTDKGIVIRDEQGKGIRMVGAMQDITEKKELENLLAKVNKLARIGSWEVNLVKGTVYWSDIKKEIHEVERDYIPDLQTGVNFYKEGTTRDLVIQKMQDAIEKGIPYDVELQIVTAGGKEKWTRSIGESESVNGKCVRVYGSFQDIDIRKRAELAVTELNEDIQKQARELAISNADLEQFAYVASHDLQEPLRMITSFLTQLEKKYGNVLDDTGKKYIDFAVDGAKRMRQIILDLLEFSRVGQTEEDQEDLDLNELVNEIQILFRKQIGEKNAVIQRDELPVIHAYKVPLRQVFQNLISNALKYSQKDIPAQIQITSQELKDHWQFTITDNGIGINPGQFDRIFIIFQRLHTKDAFPGTGMGLAVTKKIIENLGGKIWVASTEGKGSTFYFTVPKLISK